jgi:hypothetical protein
VVYVQLERRARAPHRLEVNAEAVDLLVERKRQTQRRLPPPTPRLNLSAV